MKPSKTREIDFTTVLASSIHDMKNSLCLLIQSIESLAHAHQDSAHAEAFSQLHYEAQRINMGLIQLLALYREQQQHLPVNIDAFYLAELVDELVITHEYYAEQRHIEVQVEIADDLICHGDRDLLSALLNDIFVNAIRYTADTIKVTAQLNSAGLEICINDNGGGYPETMLEAAHQPMAKLNLLEARTGLGLYFAHLIAAQHERDGVQGKIELKNGGSLGGSLFCLTLP